MPAVQNYRDNELDQVLILSFFENLTFKKKQADECTPEIEAAVSISIIYSLNLFHRIITLIIIISENQRQPKCLTPANQNVVMVASVGQQQHHLVKGVK